MTLTQSRRRYGRAGRAAVAVSTIALAMAHTAPVLGAELDGDGPANSVPTPVPSGPVVAQNDDPGAEGNGAEGGSGDQAPSNQTPGQGEIPVQGTGAAGGPLGAGGTLGIAAGLAVVGGGLALAAGGSGDDDVAASPSAPTPEDPTPVDPATPQAVEAFRTDEYLAHGGYDRVNLAHALARGHSGSGYLIAIIDDGYQLAHPDLVNNIADAHPAGGGMPIEAHGTHVAGIAAASKDGVGMHGAAYDADLALYRYEIASLSVTTDSFDRASAQGATVISNSWGYDFTVADVETAIAGGDPLTTALANVTGFGTALAWEDFLDAMANAQASGSVIVFAASNARGLGGMDVSAGMPLLDNRLMGQWLAVVNIDENDDVISVGCLEARDFCLAAPGTNITSTLPIDDYGPLTGTSMATPLVSGAVVLVIEAFGLSPSEAVTRLLTTADRSFDGYDVDDHGQGVLDLDAATRPIGRLRVLADGSVHGADGPDLAATTLLTARAFGDSLHRAFQGTPIAAFDEGGAAFLFDMGDLVMDTSPSVVASDTLLALGDRSTRRDVDLAGAGRLTMTMAPGQSETLNGLTGDRRFGVHGGMHSDATHRASDTHLVAADIETELLGGRMRIGFHQTPAGLLDRLSAGNDHGVFNYAPGLFAAPYPRLAESGYSLGFEVPVSDSVSFELLSFSGEGKDDTPFSGFGSVASLSMTPSERFAVTVDGGALVENDTFMGAEAKGAFALGGGARTIFAGVRAEAELDDRWSLMGSFHYGWTDIDGVSSSLVRSVDTVETQQLALGVVGRDVVSDGDRFGVAVSQPLRVEAGRASLTVPVWRDWSGAILTQQHDIDLRPSGRETRLEATYGFDLTDDTTVTGLAMHRFDADHVAGRQDSLALVRLRHQF